MIRRLARKRASTMAGPLSQDQLLDHASDVERRIIDRCLPHTMTGAARLLALIDAVRYCVARKIPGTFVECGVWRGGSVLAMILTLQEADAADRPIYLYDTFEGMTRPTAHDVSAGGDDALDVWREASRAERRPWDELFAETLFNEGHVRELLSQTGYPQELIRFVKGPVEETIPAVVPEEISLLRLDTDWYESTRHELEHLFPRVSENGVLIIDDYGHWKGARRAVDEYFASCPPPLLLNRIDYTGRIAVKL